MIRKKNAFIWALSITSAALLAALPMQALATEETSAPQAAEADANDADAQEMETVVEAGDITEENVNEGVDDFELPTEDQLSSNPLTTDYNEGEPSFPADESEPPEENSYAPESEEPDTSEQPIYNSPVTGQETPVVTIAGIALLAAAGVVFTLRKARRF